MKVATIIATATVFPTWAVFFVTVKKTTKQRNRAYSVVMRQQTYQVMPV